MFSWVMIAVSICVAYVLLHAWPYIWAFASRDRITRITRLCDVGYRLQDRSPKRAVELFKIAFGLLWEPEEAPNREMRRLGSDVAAAYSLTIGKVNCLNPFSGVFARNAVLRDDTNPFAYEVLGISLAWLDNNESAARDAFNTGLETARTSDPPDVEAGSRILGQISWLDTHAVNIRAMHDELQR